MIASLLAGFATARPANVPMVYYHSVVDAKDGWLFRHLSCPVSVFESHLRALRWAGFHTISLQTLYEYMANGTKVPARAVVLTFDDGYLDNWVYAYPLLRKYGLQATIFVNPDFVDPSESLRPNLEDAWSGRVSARELPTSGFLSWQEMKEMERSGSIDIQSHGLTHTWYFSSAKIVDFHHPGDRYPWLAWNVRPERKYLWMTENQQDFVPWGTPVYQHEKSLATRRYLPDADLDRALSEHVRSHGGVAFFESSDWRQQLSQLVADHRQLHGDCGRFESEAEYRARLHSELADSKQIIQKQLGKRVDFMCWPGGGYNEDSVAISRQVGYLSSEESSHARCHKNRVGEDPSRWGRIFPPWFRWSDTRYEYKGGLYFICLLNSLRGSRLYGILYKALRVPFKVAQWTGRYQKLAEVGRAA